LTYDFETWQEWRYSRPGLDPIVDGEVEKGEKKKKIDDDFENPLVHSGYSMVVWEDPRRQKIWFANT